MITLTVDADREYNLEVVDYEVTQEITPLAPGDSSGGVGSITVSAVARKDGPHHLRTSTVLDRDILLTDREDIEFTQYKGRGSVRGHVTSNAEAGGRINLTAETLLARLNTERTAAPFFGVHKSGTRVTYIMNDIINPSFETNTTGLSIVAGTGGASALTRVNTAGVAFAGSYFARQAWTTAATGVGGFNYTTNVVGGATAVYSGYARIQGGAKTAQSMRLSVEFFNGVGASLGAAIPGERVIINNTGMTRMSVTAAAPATAVTAILRFYNYNDGGIFFSNWAVGDVLALDALMQTAGTTLQSYFDGTSANASWIGTAHASKSQLAITTVVDEGYDATLANAVRYYCGLVGIEQTSVVVDAAFEGVPVAYPAWTGNVWNHLKMLCVAVGAEIIAVDSSIVFRRPRQFYVAHENADSFDTAVNAQATALAVELYNYNNRWLVNSVAAAPTNIYSVDVGTVQVASIKTPHSLTSVNSPLPSATLPDLESYVGSGAYVVTDANDVVVDPVFWSSNGGSVTAALEYESYNTIELTIAGPTELGVYTAPLRIAIAGDGKDLPAMYITGEGVFTNKQLVRTATAATLTQTSNEVAPTIDNLFISTADQAGDRAVLAAMQASGPLVSIRGQFSLATSESFLNMVGGRIRHNNSIYRVKSASVSPVSVDITAESDVLFGDVTELYSVTFTENNVTYSGFTFTTYNATWSPTTTFADVTALSPQPSFTQVNALYSSQTFNDHAIYPLLPI